MSDTTLETTLAGLRQLEQAAIVIHAQLKEMDIRSGAVGSARQLVKKLESTIAFIETNGNEWDQTERLACNAWRIHEAATGEELPGHKAWLALPDDLKADWREAAQLFRGDDGE